MRNLYAFDPDQVRAMNLAELRQALTRPGGRGLSSLAVFTGYLILAVPVGAAFFIMVLVSLPVWALTQDPIAVP
jgi:uncharacterized RDD family membrane protein YckC